MTKSLSTIAALGLIISAIPAVSMADVASTLKAGANVNVDAKQVTPEQASRNVDAMFQGGTANGPTAPAVAGKDGLKDGPTMAAAVKQQKEIAVPNVSLRDDLHNTGDNVASGGIVTRDAAIILGMGAAFGVGGAMIFGWPGAFLAIVGMAGGAAIVTDITIQEAKRGVYNDDRW